MIHKPYSIFLSILLLIINNSISILFGSIYSLKTYPLKTGDKVCLIIIDGLRYDTALKMPFVNSAVKKGGSIYKALSGTPSLSRPGYERIMAGSETFINGFNSNINIMPSLIPNLFLLSKEYNLKTAASAYLWMHEMFPCNIDYGDFYYFNDKDVFINAKKIIKNNSPDFVVIHPMDVDNAGHKYGGISNEYTQAAYRVDSEIKSIWDILYNNHYTVIITSDHGHKDCGGHGDGNIKCVEIPVFIFNNNLHNITFNKKSVISEIDIAPTICDIMGISKTIYMTGSSLIKNSDIQNIRNVYSNNRCDNFNLFLKTPVYNFTSLY